MSDEFEVFIEINEFIPCFFEISEQLVPSFVKTLIKIKFNLINI